MQSRVVVTGAAGWLGRAVVQALSESASVAVIGLTRSQVDLAVPGAFDDFLGDGASATVVHLAASLDRSETCEANDRQWRDTFLAGREVVQTSARQGVHHLVIAGSMDELGDADGVLKADLPSRPRTTYGLCKSLVREVAEFEARRSPVLIDWFRPTIVYGPGQRGPMLLPQLCAAASAGEELEVTDGKQIRDFLFVDDLVAWIRLAIERRATQSTPPPSSGFVLHHVGSARPTPVGDVFDRIEEAFPGARLKRGARPRRAHEPETQLAPADGTTISAWQPRVPWETGIARTIEWWRSASHG